MAKKQNGLVFYRPRSSPGQTGPSFYASSYHTIANISANKKKEKKETYRIQSNRTESNQIESNGKPLFFSQRSLSPSPLKKTPLLFLVRGGNQHATPMIGRLIVLCWKAVGSRGSSKRAMYIFSATPTVKA